MSNVKKTWNYLKRNGLRDTYLAALERLGQKEEYRYLPPGEEALKEQRKQALSRGDVRFSILVPAYRTNPAHLRAMLDSVLAQSYENYELLIADAEGGEESAAAKLAQGCGDERVRCIALAENRGISENTNEILKLAKGEYIGLLDHDDMLTPDALFEMFSAIRRARAQGIDLGLLYSDEDKCDETGTHYYEPHRKIEFNLDLILSNNYLCHFLVMRADLMKTLRLRAAYDGAQDYDLVLRAAEALYGAHEKKDAADAEKRPLFPLEAERQIAHIGKVLYHWRCHRASTAGNPQSKRFAYEAGRRALEDFIRRNGIPGEARETEHVGFYRVEYEDIFAARPDVGIVGYPLYDGKNKITGGIYNEDGSCPYEGLKKGFSGYMHRASLTQDAWAVDLRRIKIREELKDGLSVPDTRKGFESEEAYRRASMELCARCRSMGYRILWIPDQMRI